MCAHPLCPLTTGAEVKGAGEATPTCSPVKDASKQPQTTGECGHCTVVYVTLSEHGGDCLYIHMYAGGIKCSQSVCVSSLLLGVH